MVVCADMASYSSKEQSIDSYDLMVTVAANDYAACDQARRAPPDGCIPLAAFDQETLEKMVVEMVQLGLRPRQVFNLSQRMTDIQMQAEYAGTSMKAR